MCLWHLPYSNKSSIIFKSVNTTKWCHYDDFLILKMSSFINVEWNTILVSNWSDWKKEIWWEQKLCPRIEWDVATFDMKQRTGYNLDSRSRLAPVTLYVPDCFAISYPTERKFWQQFILTFIIFKNVWKFVFLIKIDQ